MTRQRYRRGNRGVAQNEGESVRQPCVPPSGGIGRHDVQVTLPERACRFKSCLELFLRLEAIVIIDDQSVQNHASQGTNSIVRKWFWMLRAYKFK